MSSLVAREVAFTWPGGVTALESVDVAVRPGRMTAVIGPNGAGKSTLVRVLAGLERAERGRVDLGDRAVVGVDAKARARELALVPQFLPALPEVRVLDFVLGGRYAHLRPWRGASARDREAAREALARCDVGDLEERSMAQLSGGQRQRVLIARALAQEAGLLLVDEPTTALDPEHQVRVFALLAALAREGRGILVVTHELNLAARFAHELVLLDAGRVVARGSADEVLMREILEPVYGPHLHYGRTDERDGAHPYVLPYWPLGEES